GCGLSWELPDGHGLICASCGNEVALSAERDAEHLARVVQLLQLFARCRVPTSYLSRQVPVAAAADELRSWAKSQCPDIPREAGGRRAKRPGRSVPQAVCVLAKAGR